MSQSLNLNLKASGNNPCVTGYNSNIDYNELRQKPENTKTHSCVLLFGDYFCQAGGKLFLLELK